MADIKLKASKAPNLPIPTISYSQTYTESFSNALRLYFNTLDAFTINLSTVIGGSSLSFPYLSGLENGVTTLATNMSNVSTTPIIVTSTADFPSTGFIIIQNEIIQFTGKTATTFTGITRGVKGTTNLAHTAPVAVTGAAGVAAGSLAAMNIDTVTASNGVTCTVPDSKIYFEQTGFYNIQFSAQFLNYTTSEDNITIWIRKNGTDVPYSAGIQQINASHASLPGSTIAGWNYVDPFVAGDYIEFYWASNTGNTVLATYPAGTSPVHPVAPSLIVTVTFVSRT